MDTLFLRRHNTSFFIGYQKCHNATRRYFWPRHFYHEAVFTVCQLSSGQVMLEAAFSPKAANMMRCHIYDYSRRNTMMQDDIRASYLARPKDLTARNSRRGL